MALATVTASACLPPEWGANAILHPTRRPLVGDADLPHEDIGFRSDGLLLKGWLFRAADRRRGLIVYLHGVADNRRSGLGLARRFVPQGYDVFAYDSRAHGESKARTAPIADVSPRKAAARIRVPVLLIHGGEDRETPAAHSQRTLTRNAARSAPRAERGRREVLPAR